MASGLNWAISFFLAAILRCFPQKTQIFIAAGHFLSPECTFQAKSIDLYIISRLQPSLQRY